MLVLVRTPNGSVALVLAMNPSPLNGAPLTKHQGAPLRLLVPGWYGVSNVKWLSEIHAQAERYVGKFQTRWYRTVRTEMVDSTMTVSETEVTHMLLKSFVARVTPARQQVHGSLLQREPDLDAVRPPRRPAYRRQVAEVEVGEVHLATRWPRAPGPR